MSKPKNKKCSSDADGSPTTAALRKKNSLQMEAKIFLFKKRRIQSCVFCFNIAEKK